MPIIAPLLLAFFTFASAQAVDWSGGPLGGLMKQPASQYMLAVYGAYGEASNASRSLRLRGMYLQRPRFEAQGFVDQEFASFLYFGSRVMARKYDGVAIYVGGGQVSGYIKSSDSSFSHERSYELNGVSVSAAYELRYNRLEASLEHHSFVGLAGQNQIDAYVGWPFSFFLIRLGVAI